MARFKCDFHGCGNPASVHFTRIENRLAVAQKHRCREHADEVTTEWMLARTIKYSTTVRSPQAELFDLDFMIYDDDGYATIYLHEVNGHRRVPFRGGYCDGLALDIAIRKVAPSQPVVHSTLMKIVNGLGGRLKCVVLDRYSEVENTYVAKLHFLCRDESLLVDATPSDAVILAVRCDAPLFVHNDVLSVLF